MDYLKFILADLILKKVILVERTLRKAHPKDKRARYFTDVRVGPNYSFYDAQSYEKVFLEEITPGKSRLFYHYIRAIQTEVPTDGKFFRDVLRNSELKEYFRPNFVSYLLGYLPLNSKGTRMRRELIHELNLLDKTIPQLYKRTEDLYKVIQPLGGNIFLLHKFSSVMWKRISYSFQNRPAKLDNIILDNRTLRKLDYAYYSYDVLESLDEFFFNVYQYEYVPQNTRSNFSWY